jgi:hypothetical protein
MLDDEATRERIKLAVFLALCGADGVGAILPPEMLKIAIRELRAYQLGLSNEPLEIPHPSLH